MNVGHAVALMHRNNRKVWLAKRGRVLGATDACAVLGYSKWATPVDVWLDKTGRAAPNTLDGQYVIERGNVLEGLIITEWSRRNQAALTDFPQLLAHPDYPMIAASLDGLGQIGDELVVCEAKAVTWRGRTDWWDDTIQVPDQYVVQVLMQLAVTGLERAHICADVAGEFTQVEIVRDRDFEAWALPTLADWWQTHVVDGDPPDPDPVRDYPNLNRIWAPEPAETIHADADLQASVDELRDVTAAKADADRHTKRLRGHIRVAMRTASTLLDSDGQRIAYLDSRGTLRIPPITNHDRKTS